MLEKEVTILKQDHFGNGIAKCDNLLIFVSNGLKGDKCKIKITKEKKNYLEAEIIDLLEESSERVIPKCPFYKECGGCHIMHQERNKQLLFKENKVKELLKRFADIDEDIILPIIYGKENNYRNKIVLRVENGLLGFYREKTHELVHIDECLITNSEINVFLKKVQNYLNENKENINEILIRSTTKNEIMFSIKGNVSNNFLNNFKDVTSIYVNDSLIYGKEYISEEIFGLKFKIYPNSFFQVNYGVMEILYDKVRKFYENNKYSNVLDLYCGCGTIGMIVSKFVDNVNGVEVVESAIESALDCMKINGINNINFKCGKVEDMIDSFNNIDSIIVDPPRKGLDNHTISTILELNPESIVYVSCDPVTLARDLKLLSCKYEVKEVTPFDMFPYTYHVECVCILKCRKSLK